jgi:hypothetical protein
LQGYKIREMINSEEKIMNKGIMRRILKIYSGEELLLSNIRKPRWLIEDR